MSHCKKSMWDGLYTGVNLFRKYSLPQAGFHQECVTHWILLLLSNTLFNINRRRVTIMWHTCKEEKHLPSYFKYYLYRIHRGENIHFCKALHRLRVNIILETQIIPIWREHSNEPLYTQANKQLPCVAQRVNSEITTEMWKDRSFCYQLRSRQCILKCWSGLLQILRGSSAELVNWQTELLYSEPLR